MDNIVVVETTDDLDDGIDFPDGGEKLIAETVAFGGAFDQSRDIDKLDRGRKEFPGSRKLRENLEAPVIGRPAALLSSPSVRPLPGTAWP